MTIFFASDHAGFKLKNILLAYVHDELGYDVEDCGAYELDPADDYPDYIKKAAVAVARDSEHTRAIVLGGSGQGEAVAANRIKGIRAAVYYGDAGTQADEDGRELSMLASTRAHNNANILSLGARFLSEDEAKSAVRTWLSEPFSGDERHVRRINKLDT